MHNIHLGDKRRQTIQRFLIYGLFGVVVFVLTGLSIFALKGYDLDRETGEIIRNGLILVNSHPVEAQVYLNEQLEPGRTPKRLAVPAGKHSIRLEADGYRSWQLTTNVTEGSVTWLYYPNLVPEVIEKTDIRGFDVKPNLFLSPSKKHLVIHNPKNNTLEFFETNRQENLASFKILDNDVSNLQVEDWLTHDRAVVSYRFNDRTKLVVLDINNGISQVASFSDFKQASFDGDELLILSDTSLFEVDYLADEIVLVNVANNVADLEVFDGTRYALTQDTIVNLDSNEVIFQSERPVLKFKFEDYDNDRYLALQRTDDLALYKNPQSNLNVVPIKIISVDNQVDFKFSETGRYLLVRGKTSAQTFNIERAITHKIDIGAQKELAWFDDVRLSYVENDQLFLMDYNAGNPYLIGSILPNSLPALNSDESKLVNLIKDSAEKGFTLQSSQLILEN